MNDRAVCVPFKCRICRGPYRSARLAVKGKVSSKRPLAGVRGMRKTRGKRVAEPSTSKASLSLDVGGRRQLLENDPLHHRHERTMPFHIVVTTRIPSHAKV